MAKEQNMRTYGYQSSLKPLPIPDLQHTAEVYLHSVRPLLSDAEYAVTQKHVVDFIVPGGIGEKLDKKLQERSKEELKKGKNWLEDWWLEYGYLRGRYPLPINLSCHLLMIDEFIDPNSYTQTQQAARVMIHLLEWKEKLSKELIPPDMTKGKPLCMHPFTTLFSTERQPQPELDVIATTQANNTVVVLVNNQFYVFDLVHNDKWLSASEIEVQLAKIQEDSLKNSPTHGVGEFTTLPRDNWAEIRSKLSECPTNRQNLKEIEKCVLMFSLDRDSPSNLDDITSMVATGIKDRWYDKIVNIIVFQNSRMGVLLEHTPCDAPIITRWVEDSLQNLYKEKTPVPLIRPLKLSQLPQPRKLTWNLKGLEGKLEEARNLHNSVAETKEYKICNFTEFGTDFIRKHGVSPDSFLQLSLQLAFYRLYKEIPATYESAHTRFFLHGRTECVRTQSSEVLDFVKSMLPENPKKEVSLNEKYFLFRKAEKWHLAYMADAVRGYGCDRHLFGLKLIHQQFFGGNLPEIYTDKAFSLGLQHRLSTSNVPGATYYGGFGNSVEDGYGTCYIIKPHRLDVSIVCSKPCPITDCRKFHDSLVQSFRDLRKLLEDTKSFASKL